MLTIPIKINATCDENGLCQGPGHYELEWNPRIHPVNSLHGFEFNKEYPVVQDGHEERCIINGQNPEVCQGKVKLLPGKDTICKDN